MTPLPSPSPKEWTTLHIICGALAAATAAYAGMGWFLVTNGSFELPRLAKPGGLALILSVAAVLLLLAAPLAQRLLAQDRDSRRRSMPVVPFETYRQAIIVAFALREGAAIIGLVITLLTRDVRWALALGAVAVLAMLLGWPKPAAWQRLNEDPRFRQLG